MEKNECFLCHGRDLKSFCKKCQRSQCVKCVSGFRLQLDEQSTLCVSCAMMTLNLSKRVKQELSLVTVKMNNSPQGAFLLPVTKDFSNPQIDKSQFEIRCIKLDHRGPKILGENTFPDQCMIKRDGKITQQFTKLDINSSLKKRRDNAIGINKEIYKRMFNIREKFQISANNFYDGKNSFIQDKGLCIYVFGVYEFVNQNFEEIHLDPYFITIKEEESFEFIRRISKSQTQGNDSEDQYAQIDGVEFVLTDHLTQQKMVTPGRGAYCQHITCFDVQSYLKLLISSQNLKQYCPICGITLVGIVRDILIE